MSDLKDVNRIPDLLKRMKNFKATEVRGGVIGKGHLNMIAGVNEFGMKIKVTAKMRKYLASQGLYLLKNTKHITIPERAFLRNTFDNKKTVAKIYEDSTKDIFNLDVKEKQITEQMGVLLVAAIRKSISSNIKPKNHPFTTQQKGGKNKTLIVDGNLLRGVGFRVV